MLTYPSYGIELGNGALKAVKLQRKGNRLTVTSAYYHPYARAEDGAVRPRAGLHPRADAALRAFVDHARPGSMDRICVGFPSVGTFNRLIRVPDVGEARLQEIARYEAIRSLRGPIEDYVVRTRVLDKHGDREEVPCLLYAVRKTHLDAFVTDLSGAGLEFDSLIPSPAALALFARYDRPSTEDRIIVSVGLRATDVVYVRNRGFAFRTLPLGIVGLQSITGEESRIKGVRRLVDRISREIGKGSQFFFTSGDAFQPASVSLFGEGTAVPELVKAFEHLYPGRLESIGSLHRIALGGGISEEVRPHVSHMGAALGLAIAASQADDPLIDLIEPNRARNAARRLPLLTAATITIAATAFYLGERDIKQAESLQEVQVRPEARDIEARQEQARELSGELERVIKRYSALVAYTEDRDQRAPLPSAVLTAFGPHISAFGSSDLRLLECRITRDGSGTIISGKTLTSSLDPNAPTVLRQRLSSISGIRSVDVEEVVAERNDRDETTIFAFTASTHQEDGG